MAEKKKRLTMFDAMDGALSRISGLSEAAEKAKTLPFKLNNYSAASPQPDVEEQNEGSPQESTSREHLKGVEQESRTAEQDKKAGEQDNRADQRSVGAGQEGILTEHAIGARQRGTIQEHLKRAGQLDRTTGQINRASKKSTQTVSLPFVPVLLAPPATARTPAQRQVLSYFETHGSHVSNYSKIMEETGLPYNTVRKGINKLIDAGQLTKTNWRQGSARGLQFTIYGKMGQVNRAEQQSRTTEQGNKAGQESRITKQDNKAGQESTFFKIDREDLNLSISQEDMALQWPNLSRCGFGPSQLAQIKGSLSRVGKPTDRIVQGLDHLEYELANDQLVDKSGQPVADPCSWAFRALAQNGYYRRPKGYVSPEEQAAKDAEVEARSLIAARQKAEQAQFEAWKLGLTEDELKEAMTGHPGGPKDAWLKSVWKKSAGKS